MKILALETSAKAVSAAVSEDGKILCSGYQDTGLTHSRTLMPIVEHILKNTGLTVADMDAIAVAAGPGSFTQPNNKENKQKVLFRLQKYKKFESNSQLVRIWY